MSVKTQLLITGATGFLGGTILDHLMKRPEFSTYEVTALLRSSEKAEKLRKLGISAVVGSHDNQSLMESLAAKADVVIATADSDNVLATKATLQGLKKRYIDHGIAPTFIHTSGVAVLADKETGDRATEITYDDMNIGQIESLPETAIHRNVDLLLINADLEGYVKTYILLPAAIYGTVSNTLVDQGIQNAKSGLDLTALLGRAALARGRSGVVGQGKNIIGNVHVDDTADLYILMLDAIRKGIPIGHGRQGYYFVENGEHTMYEPSRGIGEVLTAQGLASDVEPSTFTQEEIQKYLHGISVYGSNMRCQANRARSIGWKPRYTKEDFLSSVQEDVEALAAAGESEGKKSMRLP